MCRLVLTNGGDNGLCFSRRAVVRALVKAVEVTGGLHFGFFWGSLLYQYENKVLAEGSACCLECSELSLELRALLGEGSSGKVYEAEWGDGGSGVAKVGYESKLRNEKQTLERLKGVNGVEQLVHTCKIEPTLLNSRGNRGELVVALLKTPRFIASAESSKVVQSLDYVTNRDARQHAVVSVIETVVNVLCTGTAVSDVQFLIDSATGACLLIDVSESRDVRTILHSQKEDWPALDCAAVLNFLNETSAIIALPSTSLFQPQQNRIVHHALQSAAEARRMELGPDLVNLMLSIFD